MRRIVLLVALTAALVVPSAPAADPGTLRARGVGDAVDADDDETGTSGSTQTPTQPGLWDLLIVGPALGLLVLGAWVAAPRRSADGEGARKASDDDQPAPEPAEPISPREARRQPDGPEAPLEEPSSGADGAGDTEEDRGADEDPGDPPPPDPRDLPTGDDLPGPDDVSDTQPGVPRILRLGKEAVDEGDLEGAVEWFDTALAAEPDLGVAHLCRGLSLEEMGRHGEAADAFRSAAEADPGDVAARYLLARALAEDGATREALVHLRQVLDLVPELADLARDDEGFEALRDDPRFLAALGDL